MTDIGATLATLVVAAGVAVPLTSALVALIKTTIPSLKARYYPTVSVACGMAATVALAWLGGATGQGLALAVGAGFLSGLMASGLFKAGKDASRM